MKKTRRRGLLPLPAALLLACAAPSGERETAVVESAVVVGGVASSCSVNTDCLSGMQCTSVQRCACAPGKIACGDYCFDLSNDSSHCGSCTTRCAKGTSCTAGACGLSISPLFTVDTPIEIDGASAATTCSEATEAYPEYSTNTGTAAFFMPFQFKGSPSLPEAPYNWGSAWNAWATPYSAVTIPAGGVAGSDSWATTSGYSGLEYVSRIFQPSATGGSCIGIAATSATNLASAVWSYPLKCSTAAHAGTADGPSIIADLGSSALYAVENNAYLATNTIQLDIFKDCRAGQPGVDAACARTTSDLAVVGSTKSHATVTVNPCTHDAIVAYRAGAPPSSSIYLSFFTPDGLAVTRFSSMDLRRLAQPRHAGAERAALTDKSRDAVTCAARAIVESPPVARVSHRKFMSPRSTTRRLGFATRSSHTMQTVPALAHTCGRIWISLILPTKLSRLSQRPGSEGVCAAAEQTILLVAW